MINKQNFSDQPVKNDIGTYDNVQNIENGQEDD